MTAGYCKCATPKPRPSGASKVVCVNQDCHKEIRVRAKNSDTMRDEQEARKVKLEAIERQLHYLIGQVRDLKNL